jgi:hypothetical protein
MGKALLSSSLLLARDPEHCRRLLQTVHCGLARQLSGHPSIQSYMNQVGLQKALWQEA